MLKNLDISQYEDLTVDTRYIYDPLLKAIEKYENYPSFRIIKSTFKNLSTFSFHYVDESDIEKEIIGLNNSKASQGSDIPDKIIKNNLDIFKKILCQELNRSIEISRLPTLMKTVNITPVFKKADRTDEANSKPIGILQKF